MCIFEKPYTKSSARWRGFTFPKMAMSYLCGRTEKYWEIYILKKIQYIQTGFSS